MLTWFAIVFLILCYWAVSYASRTATHWRLSRSLQWPKTLDSRKQAAISKVFLARNGIKSKFPILNTMKYHLEIWQGQRCVLLSFGSPTFPPTKVLFQDLAEFRQRRFPSGTCSVVVFFQEIANTMAFDWSREFDVAILHPAQLAELADLLKSGADNLSEAIFDMSAAVTTGKARADASMAHTLFDGPISS